MKKSIIARLIQPCGQCPLPVAAALRMTNPCPHRFKGHGFCVSILFLLITNPRFAAHRFKAAKLMSAGYGGYPFLAPSDEGAVSAS